MSRWFPERAVVWVGDAALGCAAAPFTAPEESGALATTPNSVKVDAVVKAFEQTLDAQPWCQGTHLTCVIGADSVRYRIIPWSDELASPSQRQVLAKQCFVETYGDAARDWTVRDHADHFGKATLACGMDTTFLDRVDAAARIRGLKLVSIQPFLMHVHNRHLGRAADQTFKPGLFWLVTVEAGWITLLLTSPSEPVHVKQMRWSGFDLARVLDREWFALGIDVPRCPVYVVHSAAAVAARSTSPTVPGWPVVDLPPLSTGDSAHAGHHSKASLLKAPA